MLQVQFSVHLQPGAHSYLNACFLWCHQPYLSIAIFKVLFIFILLDRQKVKRRGNLLFASSLSKWLQWQRLGQTKASSQELHPHLPWTCQGLNQLSHHLLPPRVCINRNIKWEADPGFKPKHSDMECGHPTHCLNHSAKYPPLIPICICLRHSWMSLSPASFSR